MELKKKILNSIIITFILTILIMILSSLLICTFFSFFHTICFLSFYFILIGLFLFFSLPILKLPPPTGDFFIGIKSYHLIDNNRKNKSFKLSNERRELLVYTWFPTEEQNKKDFYLPELIMSNQEQILKQILKIDSHTINNAKRVSNINEKYPIIIVSHGLGSLVNFSTAQIQELVSHGYIVVGINHTDYCFLTIFSDGRVVTFDNDKFDIPMEKFIENQESLIDEMEKEIDVCVEDICFVINYLEIVNKDKNSIFFEKLDLDNIGILGHSIGGSIAAEVCRIEPRCKAGISLDGSIIEKTDKNKFSKPFMFIVGYLLNQNENLINKRIRNLKINENNFKIFNKKRKSIINLCNHIGKDAYYVTLKNASHFAFTDFTLASPILKRFLNIYLGADHGSDFAHEINNNVVAFFDKYLKQKS